MARDDGAGGAHDTVDAVGDSLTAPGLIQLDYIAPPPDLGHVITTLYHFRCDEQVIRDVQPAAVGSVMVLLRGEGTIEFAGGRRDDSKPLSILAPTSAAAPVQVDGPFHTIGAALSPLGWAMLTGLSAAECSDRLIAGQDVMGEEAAKAADAMIERYRTNPDCAPLLCAELAELIRERLVPIPPRHVQLIKSVADWLSSGLNPKLEALSQATGYSQRQLQRLVERYFGGSPKMLLRKYRALRVVALLQDPQTSDAEAAALANEFYDQSHLIREIRHFAGRTPSRLGDSSSPILQELLDVRNFREITPNVARLPGDPRP